MSVVAKAETYATSEIQHFRDTAMFASAQIRSFWTDLFDLGMRR